MGRVFREEKATSNWTIGKQTDNRAALDGRQSALLSAPLFSDAIVSPLFRSKACRTLYYALRHYNRLAIVQFRPERLAARQKKSGINTMHLADVGLTVCSKFSVKYLSDNRININIIVSIFNRRTIERIKRKTEKTTRWKKRSLEIHSSVFREAEKTVIIIVTNIILLVS